MNKRGIELPVNFLVVLIISIVVFSMGIWLIYKIYDKGIDMQQSMDEKTKNEIEGLLDDGNKIALPVSDRTVENKDFAKFGMGILNVLGNKANFNVTVFFSKAFDSNDNLIDATNIKPNDWLDSAVTEEKGPNGLLIRKSIKNNEKFSFLIVFNVENAIEGTYIFDINVTCDHPQCTPNRMYDNRVYKLRLHVK